MDSASICFVLFGLVPSIISNLSRSRVCRSKVFLLSSLTFVALPLRDLKALVPPAVFLLMSYSALV
jgi:hypothetical protein